MGETTGVERLFLVCLVIPVNDYVLFFFSMEFLGERLVSS